MPIGDDFGDLLVTLRAAINVGDADFPDIYDPAEDIPTGTVQSLLTSDKRLFFSNENLLPFAFDTQTETMRTAVSKDTAQTDETVVDLLNVIQDYFLLTDGDNLTYMIANLSMADPVQPSTTAKRIQNLKDAALSGDAITKGQLDAQGALVTAIGTTYGLVTDPNVLIHPGTYAMNANLNLGAKRLANVSDMSQGDADSTGANKAYVTAGFVLSPDDYWLLDGSNFALGSLDMGTFYIQSLGNPLNWQNEPQTVVSLYHFNIRKATIGNPTLPAGMVMPWVSNGTAPPPSGWLFCDGLGYSADQTVDGYSLSAMQAVTGTRFNHTNDSLSTRRVPDLRGRLICGFDDMDFTNDAGRITPAWCDESDGDPNNPPRGPGSAKINNPTPANIGYPGGVTWENDPTPSEVTTATETHLPATHTHAVANALLYNEALVSGGIYQPSSSPTGSSTWALSLPGGGTPDTGTAGASAPHQNTQPTLALTWIIRL